MSSHEPPAPPDVYQVVEFRDDDIIKGILACDHSGAPRFDFLDPLDTVLRLNGAEIMGHIAEKRPKGEFRIESL